MAEWSDEPLQPGVRRYRPVTAADTNFGSMLDAWSRRADASRALIATLAGVPCRAFLWETPPVTRDSLDRPFEFVVTDCPELDRTPDPAPFAEHFGPDPASCARFENLGGDATLVAPGPVPAPRASAHLGAFCRGAPVAAQLELWCEVAVALRAGLGASPLWLSTSGLGVAWLHVRLDSTPKYYSHAPYRRPPD